MDYSRIRVFFKLSLIFFSIIVIRVLYLQFFDETVKKRSELNMVRTTVIEPSRGKILDRNGKLIIDNQYAYNLYVVPVNFLRSEYSVGFISEKLKIEKDSLIKEITSPGVYSDRYYRIIRDIDFSLYSSIAEKGNLLSGVFVKKEWTRKFEVETAPHIIGYLGEARDPEEIKDDIEYGDLIGKEGIEYIYDEILRGAKGYTKEIRDVKGNKVSNYKPEEWKKPVKGKDVYLTIDLDLQLFIEKLISKKSATVVVQDCTNGEILAIASKPDYPLSLFSGKLSRSEWKRWSEDPGKPLYNKAIMGLYPPGSVVKMGTVIAAAEQDLKDPEDLVNCPGGMQIGNRFIKCWLHSGHGNVNMLQAMMMSCDTYFYDIALSVDVNKWKDTMESFGFGRKTGIDLKYERAGLVPDYDYYRKRIKGDLTGRYANLMIGQGEFLTTPLQISNFTAILAENGKKSTPHLLLKYGNGGDFYYFQDSEPDTVVIDPKILRTVKQAMYHVVNTEGGTAHRAKSSIITFAGKTGTAENPHGEDHAWFNSFGPYEDPEIVVTVFEEHGLSGSLASLIAKDIYEFIYTKKSPE